MKRSIAFTFVLVIILLAIITIQNAYSSETDPYMVWGEKLQDSTKAADDLINKLVQNSLDNVNKQEDARYYSCQQVAEKIAKDTFFKRSNLGEMFDAIWGNKEFNLFPAREIDVAVYKAKSIYRTTLPAKNSALARMIWANNVYFGIDKLEHFLRWGGYYYLKYIGHMKKGYSEEVAHSKTVHHGLWLEKTFLGLLTGGTLSYGDLEANYQGFLMTKDFCNNDNPYLYQKEDGSWGLNKIDMRKYINPNWDEGFNTNGYQAIRWKLIRKEFIRLKDELCPKLESEAIKNLIANYKSVSKESYNMKICKEQQTKGKLADPYIYSAEKFCKETY